MSNMTFCFLLFQVLHCAVGTYGLYKSKFDHFIKKNILPICSTCIVLGCKLSCASRDKKNISVLIGGFVTMGYFYSVPEICSLFASGAAFLSLGTIYRE